MRSERPYISQIASLVSNLFLAARTAPNKPIYIASHCNQVKNNLKYFQKPNYTALARETRLVNLYGSP